MLITKQDFGRTGHLSTRLIFGAYALSDATQQQADQVLALILKHGLNHIDTAPLYGSAEERIGPWMEQHRKDFFIATKTRKRACQAAWDDLRRSLEKLRVDSIDLWQMHGLTNPVGWEKAMGKGGTLEAFIKARDEGLVRFFGVTGHGPKTARMHIQSLERFDFDTVLLPYSYWQMQNQRYAEDFNQLTHVCRDRKVAIQTIKAVARRPWADQARNFNTYFYEPLVEQEAIDKAVHWSLGLADSFLITAGDIQILPKILDAAVRYEKQPSTGEMDELTDQYAIQPIFS